MDNTHTVAKHQLIVPTLFVMAYLCREVVGLPQRHLVASSDMYPHEGRSIEHIRLRRVGNKIRRNLEPRCHIAPQILYHSLHETRREHWEAMSPRKTT